MYVPMSHTHTHTPQAKHFISLLSDRKSKLTGRKVKLTQRNWYFSCRQTVYCLSFSLASLSLFISLIWPEIGMKTVNTRTRNQRIWMAKQEAGTTSTVLMPVVKGDTKCQCTFQLISNHHSSTHRRNNVTTMMSHGLRAYVMRSRKRVHTMH